MTQDNIDGFAPFAFNSDDVLKFENPIGLAAGDEETKRVDLINLINLDDGQRGWIPGNLIGEYRSNTPSLLGAWYSPSYLHHALARSIREAILGPGHPCLKQGLFLNGSHPDLLQQDAEQEVGWAANDSGSLEAHGKTQGLTCDEVDALVAFVQTL